MDKRTPHFVAQGLRKFFNDTAGQPLPKPVEDKLVELRESVLQKKRDMWPARRSVKRRLQRPEG